MKDTMGNICILCLQEGIELSGVIFCPCYVRTLTLGRPSPCEIGICCQSNYWREKKED